MGRYDSEAGIVTTNTPGRLAGLEPDVLVPAAQAGLLGLAVGLGAGILVLLLGPPLGLRQVWPWAGRLAGVAGVLTWATSTVLLLVDHRRLLWALETVTGGDLDRDGYVGSPTTTIQITDPGGRRLRFVDLPIGDDLLTDVARAVQNGAAFSRRGLSTVLSQHEYEVLSAAMLRGGLLRELSDRSREPTPSGRALMRKLVV